MFPQSFLPSPHLNSSTPSLIPLTSFLLPSFPSLVLPSLSSPPATHHPALPPLQNLGSLVRMPYGCGEQNMINFAPNIFVLQYLEASDKTTSSIAEKAIEYMKSGESDGVCSILSVLNVLDSTMNYLNSSLPVSLYLCSQ